MAPRAKAKKTSDPAVKEIAPKADVAAKTKGTRVAAKSRAKNDALQEVNSAPAVAKVETSNINSRRGKAKPKTDAQLNVSGSTDASNAENRPENGEASAPTKKVSARKPNAIQKAAAKVEESPKKSPENDVEPPVSVEKVSTAKVKATKKAEKKPAEKVKKAEAKVEAVPKAVAKKSKKAEAVLEPPQPEEAAEPEESKPRRGRKAAADAKVKLQLQENAQLERKTAKAPAKKPAGASRKRKSATGEAEEDKAPAGKQKRKSKEAATDAGAAPAPPPKADSPVEEPANEADEAKPKSKAATKRKAPAKKAEEVEVKPAKVQKPAAEKKGKAEKPKMNATASDFGKIDFGSDKDFSLKITSWNVAGLRAVVAKNGFDYFEHEKPNIICLQVDSNLVSYFLFSRPLLPHISGDQMPGRRGSGSGKAERVPPLLVLEAGGAGWSGHLLEDHAASRRIWDRRRGNGRRGPHSHRRIREVLSHLRLCSERRQEAGYFAATFALE